MLGTCARARMCVCVFVCSCVRVFRCSCVRVFKGAVGVVNFPSLALNPRRRHFDWYMWPIEDGSKVEYNVWADDVQELFADKTWRQRYLESAWLVARAWGWDLDRRSEAHTHAYTGTRMRVVALT